jgi:hypothetical protein
MVKNLKKILVDTIPHISNHPLLFRDDRAKILFIDNFSESFVKEATRVTQEIIMAHL